MILSKSKLSCWQKLSNLCHRLYHIKLFELLFLFDFIGGIIYERTKHSRKPTLLASTRT